MLYHFLRPYIMEDRNMLKCMTLAYATLMFVDKARNLPLSGAQERYSIRVGSSLTWKY